MKANNGKKLFSKHILLIITSICFLFTLPLFKEGFYVTHDSEPQLARMTAVYKAVADGHIPPRWSGDLNFGYGTPSSNFFFPLNGYLLAILHTIGFPLQDSFKLLMGVSLIASTSFFYLWMSELFDKRTAFFTSFFYGLAPYHLLNIFVRGQLGETLAFVFAPLLFYLIERNIKKPQIQLIVFGGITYFFLIVSHNILGLLFSCIAVLYILLRGWGKWNNLLSTFLMMFSGLMLSAYFWIPALYENKYINSELFVKGFFRDHFIRPLSLFYSEWGYGSNINDQGGLSPYIGIVHGVLLVTSFVLIFYSSSKRYIGFWIAITMGAIFMTQSISLPLWERFHILEQFQFPWRYLAIASFTLPVLVGYVFSKIQNIMFLASITALMILLSFPLIQPKDYVNKPDNYYMTYPGTGAYHGESTTIWTAGDHSAFAKNPVEVISGEAEITNYQKKTHIHTYFVDAKSHAKLVDNTVYFPGWKVFVDSQPTEIQFQDPNYRGLITYNVGQGIHTIEVVFTETKIRKLADIISLLTFCFLIVVFLFSSSFQKVFNKL